ncbi:hypothetical protein FA15DRAFT_704239 [Coprinopsis marcescibilis]|uniref:Uncharacterized protein n=1 Tax=Coprinopsis marcescibilis TaxID=230819 RepID=A0A5C3KWI1_COPMA|nr:hypothetical protein FA15DRAFT_704239 [Coprinopsis marcescibilis]
MTLEYSTTTATPTTRRSTRFNAAESDSLSAAGPSHNLRKRARTDSTPNTSNTSTRDAYSKYTATPTSPLRTSHTRADKRRRLEDDDSKIASLQLTPAPKQRPNHRKRKSLSALDDDIVLGKTKEEPVSPPPEPTSTIARRVRKKRKSGELPPPPEPTVKPRARSPRKRTPKVGKAPRASTEDSKIPAPETHGSSTRRLTRSVLAGSSESAPPNSSPPSSQPPQPPSPTLSILSALSSVPPSPLTSPTQTKAIPFPAGPAESTNAVVQRQTAALVPRRITRYVTRMRTQGLSPEPSGNSTTQPADTKPLSERRGGSPTPSVTFRERSPLATVEPQSVGSESPEAEDIDKTPAKSKPRKRKIQLGPRRRSSRLSGGVIVEDSIPLPPTPAPAPSTPTPISSPTLAPAAISSPSIRPASPSSVPRSPSHSSMSSPSQNLSLSLSQLSPPQSTQRPHGGRSSPVSPLAPPLDLPLPSPFISGGTSQETTSTSGNPGGSSTVPSSPTRSPQMGPMIIDRVDFGTITLPMSSIPSLNLGAGNGGGSSHGNGGGASNSGKSNVAKPITPSAVLRAGDAPKRPTSPSTPSSLSTPPTSATSAEPSGSDGPSTLLSASGSTDPQPPSQEPQDSSSMTEEPSLDAPLRPHEQEGLNLPLSLEVDGLARRPSAPAPPSPPFTTSHVPPLSVDPPQLSAQPYPPPVIQIEEQPVLHSPTPSQVYGIPVHDTSMGYADGGLMAPGVQQGSSQQDPQLGIPVQPQYSVSSSPQQHSVDAAGIPQIQHLPPVATPPPPPTPPAYAPPPVWEESPRLDSEKSMWRLACKVRVWDLRRRYSLETIRAIVAQEAHEYYERHGFPLGYYGGGGSSRAGPSRMPLVYGGQPIASGSYSGGAGASSSRLGQLAMKGGSGEGESAGSTPSNSPTSPINFMDEPVYDWEINSSDEEEFSDDEDDDEDYEYMEDDSGMVEGEEEAEKSGVEGNKENMDMVVGGDAPAVGDAVDKAVPEGISSAAKGKGKAKEDSPPKKLPAHARRRVTAKSSQRRRAASAPAASASGLSTSLAIGPSGTILPAEEADGADVDIDMDAVDSEDVGDDEEFEDEEGQTSSPPGIPTLAQETEKDSPKAVDATSPAIDSEEAEEAQRRADLDEALSDPSFNLELSSPTSPVLALAAERSASPDAPTSPSAASSQPLVNPGGVFNAFYVPPPSPTRRPVVMGMYGGALDGEPAVVPEENATPSSVLPMLTGYESQGAEVLQEQVAEYGSPLSSISTLAPPSPVSPLQVHLQMPMSPILELPPPRLSTVRVWALRNMDMMVGGSMGRGTPVDQDRRGAWARAFSDARRGRSVGSAHGLERNQGLRQGGGDGDILMGDSSGGGPRPDRKGGALGMKRESEEDRKPILRLTTPGEDVNDAPMPVPGFNVTGGNQGGPMNSPSSASSSSAHSKMDEESGFEPNQADWDAFLASLAVPVSSSSSSEGRQNLLNYQQHQHMHQGQPPPYTPSSTSIAHQHMQHHHQQQQQHQPSFGMNVNMNLTNMFNMGNNFGSGPSNPATTVMNFIPMGGMQNISNNGGMGMPVMPALNNPLAIGGTAASPSSSSGSIGNQGSPMMNMNMFGFAAGGSVQVGGTSLQLGLTVSLQAPGVNGNGWFTPSTSPTPSIPNSPIQPPSLPGDGTTNDPQGHSNPGSPVASISNASSNSMSPTPNAISQMNLDFDIGMGSGDSMFGIGSGQLPPSGNAIGLGIGYPHSMNMGIGMEMGMGMGSVRDAMNAMNPRNGSVVGGNSSPGPEGTAGVQPPTSTTSTLSFALG